MREFDGGIGVEDSEKSVGNSGTVISEHWCLPKLNLSRIDAKSRIGFRFVGEGSPKGTSPNRLSSHFFFFYNCSSLPKHNPASPLNALFEFHFIFQ